MQVLFRTLIEDQPGDRWIEFFNRHWTLYRSWFLREGEAARPRYLTCRKKLREYMPELVPLYDRLVSLAGGGDLEARFLSLYGPPPYLSGCSHLAFKVQNPYLIRNYDYSPKLFEGGIWHTRWTRPVIGMSDSLWGLLDGINDAGLCISLSFGGSRRVGTGFGIPLIVRYVLETCTSTQEASEALKAIPSHMAYNLTLIDRAGTSATAYFSPDEPTIIEPKPCATNHQASFDWIEYIEQTQSVQRLALLDRISVPGHQNSVQSISQTFLHTPLYSTDFVRGFATLYTALYSAADGTAWYLWPGFSLIRRFSDQEELDFWVQLA